MEPVFFRLLPRSVAVLDELAFEAFSNARTNCSFRME
jgi:hypothetical protein